MPSAALAIAIKAIEEEYIRQNSGVSNLLVGDSNPPQEELTPKSSISVGVQKRRLFIRQSYTIHSEF